MAIVYTRACVCCGWESHDGASIPQVCERCRGRMRADLADLVALYTRLADELTTGSSSGPKVSGSRTPPAPGRIDVINLRGNGGEPSRHAIEQAGGNTDHLADQHGNTPIVAWLRGWEAEWRDRFGETSPRFEGSTEETVTALVRYLTRHLDKACDELESAAEFRSELRNLHRACEQAAAELVHLVKLGPCPGSGDQACGSLLRADPHATGVSCRSCGAYWDRAHLLFLGEVLSQEEGA